METNDGWKSGIEMLMVVIGIVLITVYGSIFIFNKLSKIYRLEEESIIGIGAVIFMACLGVLHFLL